MHPIVRSRLSSVANRELSLLETQALRLMDRHQLHCICGLIYLTFAFATADCFKLFDVTHESRESDGCRTFEPCGECEQALDVREPLRAVEICSNDCEVLRLVDGITKQVLDRVMMPPCNELPIRFEARSRSSCSSGLM